MTRWPRLKEPVFDILEQAVLVLDRKFTILSANSGSQKMFQLEGDPVGKNLFELVSFQKEIEVKKQLADFLTSSTRIESREFGFYRPAGLKVRAKILLLGKGKKSGRYALMVLEDISGEKRRAQEIASQNEETKKLILIALDRKSVV